MSISEEVTKVRTRADLVSFIGDLAQDLRTNPHAWQNSNLPSFLDAMSGWVEDMDGYYENRGEPAPDTPSWRIVAEILIASKVYE